MKRVLGRRGVATAVVVVVAIAVGGIAYAAIPDSSGVIHGCYQKNGNLRVIDSSSEKGCRPSEKPLSWSQTGPRGLTGSTGPTGATGTSGVSGYEVVSQTKSFTVNAGIAGALALSLGVTFCPTGKVVIGGGAEGTQAAGVPAVVSDDHPVRTSASDPYTGWEVSISKPGGVPFAQGDVVGLVQFAICANAS
jgi:hypothetical protein